MTLAAPPEIAQATALAVEGGPATAVCAALEQALVEAIRTARPDAVARLSALNIELNGAVVPGEPLVARAWVERATRTLAFVSADIVAGDRRVASGGGVFELS